MFSSTYSEIFRRMPLIEFMAKRNRRANVADTALGVLWDVITPASNMLIYYFLIAVVFQRGGAYPAPAYLFIIIGISHYLTFQRILGVSCKVIRNNSRILMQIPIEPIVFFAMEVRRGLAEYAVYFALCAALYLLSGHPVPGTIVFYPLLVLFFFFTTWSVGVIIATAGVFMRDIANLVPIVLRLMLYCSAVLYPLSLLPPQYQEIMLINPLAVWFSLLHWSLFGSPLPPVGSIIGLVAFSLICFVAGNYLYDRFKPQFTKAL